LTLLVVATTDGDVKTAQVATIKMQPGSKLNPPLSPTRISNALAPPSFFLNFYLKNFIQQRHREAAWGLSVQQFFFFFGLDYFLLFTASSLSLSLVPTPENAKLVFFVDRDRVRLP
jgi:hypothetical protein